MNTLRKLLCWLEIHDSEIIYRDAVGMFTTGWNQWYKEYQLAGDILRCRRPACNKLTVSSEIRLIRTVVVGHNINRARIATA